MTDSPERSEKTLDPPGGGLAVTRLEQARAVLQDASYEPIDFPGYLERMQEASGRDLSRLIAASRASLVYQSGQSHRHARRLFAKFFSRAGVEAWQPTVADCTRRCLDAFDKTEQPDLVHDLVDPLFTSVIPSVIGLHLFPGDEERLLNHVAQARHLVEPLLPLRMLLATQEGFDWIMQLIERSYDEPFTPMSPRSLLGQLRRQGGKGFTRRELISMVSSLTVAAHTTSETLAYILWRLLRAPESERRAAVDPEWVARYLESLLRLYPSTVWLGRVASRPSAVAGCPVQTGEPVWLHVPSANRDPDVYPSSTDSGPINGANCPANHLSFGAGAHKCPGAYLARMTIRTALPMILGRFPHLCLCEDGVRWPKSAAIIGMPTALPCDLGVPG